MTVLALLLAQTDAPDPLLPDSEGVIWTNVMLISLVAVAVLVLGWRACAYIRETRRGADEAAEEVAELREERQGTGAS